MNCAIDAATPHQSAIGSIDDRVYLLFGDITDFHHDSTVQKSFDGVHRSPIMWLIAKPLHESRGASTYAKEKHYKAS